jgi:hypothetical protein
MYKPELAKYRRNVYSQIGEDGVLAEILRRLEIGRDWFCEFGAWDGRHLSNTYSLAERGWSGVEIEADPERFRDLQETARRHDGRLHAINAFVAPEGDSTLDRLLSRTPIPRDFAVLSIDVDSSDYRIWQSLRDYSPRIVIIEVNSSFAPGVERVHTEAEPGSSFTSTLRLGREKGYSLVLHTGNMIFVRNDLVSRLGLPQKELENAELLFDRFYLPTNAVHALIRRVARKLRGFLRGR